MKCDPSSNYEVCICFSFILIINLNNRRKKKRRKKKGRKKNQIKSQIDDDLINDTQAQHSRGEKSTPN